MDAFMGFDYEQSEVYEGEGKKKKTPDKKKHKYFCLRECWVNHLESSKRICEPGTRSTMKLKQ